jgi:hypothetical protein
MGDWVLFAVIGSLVYLYFAAMVHHLTKSRFGRFDDDERTICAIFWPMYLTYLVIFVGIMFLFTAFFGLVSRLITKTARRGKKTTQVVK